MIINNKEIPDWFILTQLSNYQKFEFARNFDIYNEFNDIMSASQCLIKKHALYRAIGSKKCITEDAVRKIFDNINKKKNEQNA